MTDMQLDGVTELRIAERDGAARDATGQLVTAVLELRAAVGATPYITTMLNMIADVDQVLGKLAEITDKSERWLTINANVAAPSATQDVELLLRDLRRDLKGVTAALSAQHRYLHRSISSAWSAISHRDGVVGRETW
jgi:hypothetical protein